MIEGLGGGCPVECLAGSCVEFGGDGVEVGLGVRGEVGALGQVLAQQPVGVLVGAALPGAAGVAEVDLDAGATVNPACPAISLPWSQVKDWTRWRGRSRMRCLRAAITWSVVASLPRRASIT